MENNKEIWKPVKNYEGLYEVSTFGRIKSLERIKYDKNGLKKPIHSKFLTWNKATETKRHPNSHYTVELWKDNKRKRMSVHRLVAETFIPNPEGKPQVNHIDGIPSNNHVENLEWVTNSENVRHAYTHGLHKTHGEIPIVAINKITGNKLYFRSCNEAARSFGVTQRAILAPLHHAKYAKSCCGYIIQYQDQSVTTIETTP